MATVTFKNRSSSDYRFTCESLNDPIISELKEMIAFTNTFVHRRNSYHPTLAKLPTRGLRIRPRGPRAALHMIHQLKMLLALMFISVNTKKVHNNAFNGVHY